MKIKAITYRQLADTLNHLLETGARDPNAPFELDGRYVTEINGKNDEGVICYGTVEVEQKPRHIKIFDWE